MAGETSDEELEDDHIGLLRTKCRLCGHAVGDREYSCSSFSEGFSNIFGIDVNSDVPNIHPPYVCHKCRCIFDRYAKDPRKDSFQTFTTPYRFVAHSDSCEICFDTNTVDHTYSARKPANKKGRKRKVDRRAGPGRGGKKSTGGDHGGTTQSSSHTDQVRLMEVSTQTDPDVCGYVIDPLQPNLDEVPVPLLCKLVTEAASLQREHIIKDISNIGGMYKHPEVLVNTDQNKYFSNRNAVCQSFVNGLASPPGNRASRSRRGPCLERKVVGGSHPLQAAPAAHHRGTEGGIPERPRTREGRLVRRLKVKS
ncbi:Hypp6231 [Branchiostoma lanceolatum]|uniref:Hypp6231 protein n=1 Tax=Branchiostoma lanceolatum TaxID=7740 RepID=A0A8J9YSF0_BRALA|nr:Hypp6231 [Branchiostoma lanceolatum]